VDSARRKTRNDQRQSKRKKERKERRLTLLDVVVGKGSSIFELLSGEDESLLVRRNTLLVLNLGFDVVDSIGRLDLESDGLSSQAGEEKGRGEE